MQKTFKQEEEGKTKTGPLIYRYYNIYANFSFRYEAEECLTEFYDYLNALTIQYGTFSTLAASYNRGYDRKNNPVATQINSTLEFVEKNNGLHEVPDDSYQWCYVVDRPIKMHFVVIGTTEYVSRGLYSNQMYVFTGYQGAAKSRALWKRTFLTKRPVSAILCKMIIICPTLPYAMSNKRKSAAFVPPFSVRLFILYPK